MDDRTGPGEKARLRTEMIARRDAFPAGRRERIAAALGSRLAALPQYAAARSVLATMSIGSEWSTRPFLDRARADNKAIVLPRITSAKPRRLELYQVADLAADLVPGVWDIPEPDPARCRAVALGEVDLALIPALAADRHGYRLGYGAGYFDRLLAGRGPKPFCVTALPAAFVLERIPHDPHDVAVDLVLGEAGPADRK
jgi:5-formyltetrahydrofolate cyclo-ligase